MGGCVQEKDIWKVEKDLNVQFPEISDKYIPANRLVWKIFLYVADSGGLFTVLVTPLDRDDAEDSPLMSLVEEDFRWDMPFKEMVDQIEMKIFSKIGQSMELSVVFDSYPPPYKFDRNGISGFLKRRRI